MKGDLEVVLEAAKQKGCALIHASSALCNGGLQAYLTHMKDNVFNVSRQTFVATILFGAKSAPSAAISAHPSYTHLCDNSKCVLSRLRPSETMPTSMSSHTKKLIWEFAGVRSGRGWDAIETAGAKIILW